MSATSNDKLYHWRLRQRKRYHLTLFRMPHLKRQSSGLGEDAEGDKSDGGWLATLPAVTEKDVESDEKTAELMRRK